MEQDILIKVREKAASIYKDEKDVELYMKGFMDKVASIFDSGKIVEGLNNQVGRAAGAAVVGAGLYGIASLFRGVKESNKYRKFRQALAKSIQMNRVLKAAPVDKVVSYAHTIYKFAPSVATDENMLSSILANAIHGEGIDPTTVRALTELESRYQDTTGFTPKEWV